MSYNPSSSVKAILDQGIRYIKSVPYSVSLRWLCYQLLQDGTFKDKSEFSKLKNYTIKARKGFYGEWKPDTLVDESRRSIYQHGEFENPVEWLESLKELKCTLDEWYLQPFYVEVWFEAEAMKGQFEHYTEHVTLRPFKGDASIPFKWDIAKRLEWYSKLYQKPIKILYFGDCDKKGKQIPWSALKDIRSWCEVDFDFEACGLTLEQAKKYNLPENPEKPGNFQWEALPDQAAKKIILGALTPYLNRVAFIKVSCDEEDATSFFQSKLSEIDFSEKEGGSD